MVADARTRSAEPSREAADQGVSGATYRNQSLPQEDIAVTPDFSPLYRSTVGFDRLFTMLDSLGQPDQGQISALQYRAHR